MDFHGMLRRAGKQRTDILLAPSSDWKDIDPIHTRMAMFRGMENGCSVVRQTNKGLSMAADYQGRTLAATDYFRSADHHLVAEVPTRGVVTIYSRIGDLFAWACLAAFALFAGVAAGARPGRL
jgi:apolipoprotein N-acyltransferase